MSSPVRLLHLVRSSGVALASALVATTAVADPSFPSKLQKDLGMPCVPPCTVCHHDNGGGFGTLRDPGFGQHLKQVYDLNVTNPTSLEDALQGLKGEQPPSDIDGDGVSDLDELKKGDDPNDPASGASVCLSGPEFGCVRVAKPGPVDDVAGVASATVLVLGLAALRRRRRRER